MIDLNYNFTAQWCLKEVFFLVDFNNNNCLFRTGWLLSTQVHVSILHYFDNILI